jgi:hypothetical protein
MGLLIFNLLRKEQVMEALEDSLSSDSSLIEANEIEEAFERLTSKLSNLEEAQLVELAVKARYLEWCAFILRGMCAAELRRRHTARLEGGRGKRDKAGDGIQARMTQLAESIGVSRTTLETDARICEMFFSSEIDTALAREHTFPREFYVIALSAPNPWEAIETAVQHIAEGPYSRDQFREDVRTLKQATSHNYKEAKTGRNYLLRVRVSREVRDALNELSEAAGESIDQVVSGAILTKRKALARRSVKGKPAEVDRRHDDQTIEATVHLQPLLMPLV